MPVRLYDRLFMVEDPSAEKKDFRELMNPESLIKRGCKVEEYLKRRNRSTAPVPAHRLFHVDDSTDGNLVFNRTVALKDS